MLPILTLVQLWAAYSSGQNKKATKTTTTTTKKNIDAALTSFLSFMDETDLSRIQENFALFLFKWAASACKCSCTKCFYKFCWSWTQEHSWHSTVQSEEVAGGRWLLNIVSRREYIISRWSWDASTMPDDISSIFRSSRHFHNGPCGESSWPCLREKWFCQEGAESKTTNIQHSKYASKDRWCCLFK